jgi:ABC-type glycerol-3-phosphate transport system substrate-binding protein
VDSSRVIDQRENDEHCWEQAVDGEVTADVLDHLSRCAECRVRALSMRSAARIAQAWIPPAPDCLDVRVLAAVEAERQSRRLRFGRRPAANTRKRPRVGGLRRPRVGGLRRPPILVGAIALVAVVIAMLVVTRPPPLVTDQSQAVNVRPLSGYCTPSHQLTVAGVWSGREGSDFARVLGAFEQRTGINVTYAYETHSIATKLQNLIRQGCAPDVALLPQPGTMKELAAAGDLKPLDSKVAAMIRHNYSAAWRRLGTEDGRLYGVWFKGAAKSMIWYRPAAFRAAGITHVPRTWQQLLSDSKRLHRAGIQPFAIGGGDGWTLTDWFSNLYLATAGPIRYQELADNRIKWTSPSVKHALNLLSQIIGNPSISGTRQASARVTFPHSVRDVFGPQPKAAMVFEGDFVSSFLPHTKTGLDARFFNFPGLRPEKAPPIEVGGDVAVVLTSSPAAQKLAAFLASPAAAEVWIRRGGFISPNRGVSVSAYPNDLLRRLSRRLVDARSIRFGLSDQEPAAFGSDPYQGMWSIFQAFLAHPHEQKTVMQRLEIGATAAAKCERAVGGDC